MSALSNYGENLLADYLATQGTHIALYSSNPDEDNSGSELSGNGYARQSIAWSSASGGAIQNSGALSFGAATGSNWVAITHFGILDALTGGNLIAYGIMNASGTVNVGETFDIAIGGVTITGA